MTGLQVTKHKLWCYEYRHCKVEFYFYAINLNEPESPQIRDSVLVMQIISINYVLSLTHVLPGFMVN